ncbi:uncharacterized protein LOC112564274 isoform X2 [Pomacea canaliculata]|uniref:uncharacterized protein LOC112564274 isoform X2 n=1 Tax=Pomacea canaliculata TaxID=400727 RepID=UPI000D72D232|nr:uncharacterized protein LOC112564274 isoform X2 [Pomacea canaliculata]
MAGSLTFSVDICVRQNVSWSKDNKIAVNVDKELYILKLDCSPQQTNTGFNMRVAQTFSAANLGEKHIPWKNLEDILKNADKTTRNAFLADWTFSKLGSGSGLSPAWGPCCWSPDNVGPNHRSILAALTLDHQIHLFGQPGSLKKLADLSNQLSSSVADEFNVTLATISSPSSYVLKVQEQMASIAAVELTWSSILQGDGDAENKFLLLFVGMKNGDVVIWKLQLPVLGLQDCSILSRHSLHNLSAVTSLTWTDVPQRKHFGILGVGYEDGCVYLLPLQWEADSLRSQTFLTGSTVIESEADNMSVSCMTWMQCDETGPVLLYAKEHVLNSHCLSFPDNNIPDVLLTKSTSVCLGNSFPITCLECVGSTILMATQNGSVQLVKVEHREAELHIECERSLPFQHKEAGWICRACTFSPNAALCIALFSPSFSYDPAAQRFKDPTKIHMCCVPTCDMSSVESIVTSETDQLRCYSDVLEFSRQVVCGKAFNHELVGDMTRRLMSMSDTRLGMMVSRHMLTTLQHACQNRPLDMEVLEAVTMAQQNTTESILCNHILNAWLNLSNKRKEDITREDMSTVNTMFKWVQGSADKMERIGLEVIDGLNSVISQAQVSQETGCSICGAEQKYSGSLSAQCTNEHTFGICTKTLAVCQDFVYQYCSLCGALALSVRKLERLDWLPGDPALCTLCSNPLTISTAEYVM